MYFRMPDKRVQQLEKDLYYYKKTSRELKQKLKEQTGQSTDTTRQSVVDDSLLALGAASSNADQRNKIIKNGSSDVSARTMFTVSKFT